MDAYGDWGKRLMTMDTTHDSFLAQLSDQVYSSKQSSRAVGGRELPLLIRTLLRKGDLETEPSGLQPIVVASIRCKNTCLMSQDPIGLQCDEQPSVHTARANDGGAARIRICCAARAV